MKKGIITEYNEYCLFCGRPVEAKHHLIGGPNRKKAEEDGLKIPCCNNCHNISVAARLNSLIKRRYRLKHFEIECEVALNKYSAQLCADWDETRTRMLKGDGKWFREERRKADGNRTQ